MASSGSSLLKGRWAIWILSLAFSLLAGFGVLALLSSAAQQVTYYVMNKEIPENVQITSDMLSPRTANADGVPDTALPASIFDERELYSKVPLKIGDPVTASVVKPAERVAVELPDGYVAVSLAVTPENAVAGKVKAGDYIDIAAVVALSDGGSMSRIVMHHVLVLDVTVSPDTIERAANTNTVGNDAAQPGPDSVEAKSGIPQVYTLAVSPENFATLALVREQDPYIALSQGAVPGGLDVTITTTDQFEGGLVLDSSTGGDTTGVVVEEGTEVPTDGTVTEDPDAAVPSESAAPLAPLPSESAEPMSTETPVAE